ncbi:sugar phosphate isomerase/epimerase [Enterococcus faecium]|nr:sugar phosphate isomerase/epimerase [Enterococcus faecium]EKG9126542.1 sugar phosphate isomerase/epimerase [Enterococcus faecium]
MNNFTITGFADEIASKLDTQIKGLKENGISHIEIRGINGKNISELTLQEAQEYHQQLQEVGIKVSSLGSPIGKISIEDSFEEHLALFQHVLELAGVFASPYVRMFSFFIPEGKEADEYHDEVVARWKQFLLVAKDHTKVTLLHENEKGIYGDTPERCLKLLKALNSSQVKAAFDPANFVQCDVEVFPHAYNLLKDFIDYMHIKDAKYADHSVTPAGKGDGKVGQVLSALVADKFKGFTSLEPHLSMFDGFTDLEKEGVSIVSEKSDGEKLFAVASDALKEIIVEDLGQEWK